MTPAAGSASAAVHTRVLRFYDGDESLARLAGDFLADGIEAGSPVIIIGTAALRSAVVRELTQRSIDVAEKQRAWMLLMLDAEETLSTFMVQDRPDARRFREQIVLAIDRVRGDRPDQTVRIFGQMVDILWQRGERDAAVRLEVLWDRLVQSEGYPLLVAYAVGHFYKSPQSEDVRDRPCSQARGSESVQNDVHG